MSETFASISTPAGVGGIGIVRISGSNALKVLGQVFDFLKKPELIIPRKMYLGDFLADNEPLDKCLAVFFKSPFSYTGEDLIEFHLHGGEFITKKALSEILKYCRPAEPGEFTKTAFLNDKIDLIKAESVANLIDSTTSLSSKKALQNLSGEFSEKIQIWEKRLLRLLAEVEVNLDYYDDEDLPNFDLDFHRSESNTLKEEVYSLLKTYKTGKILREGARVVLAGFPNSGKSSLFNFLLGRNRAIVSDIAGTTRDTLEELIDLDGVPVILVDTAGIRENSDDPIEKFGIARSREELEKADFVLWLSTAENLDQSMNFAEEIHKKNKNLAFLITKIDERKIKINPDKNIKIFETSVKIPGTIKPLLNFLRESFVGGEAESENLTITTERQKRNLSGALESLGNALTNLESTKTLDILGEDYRETLGNFSKLLGKEFGPDVLDEVFANFCVGK